MLYKFNTHCISIKNKDKVILGSRYTGKWVNFSTEVYEIFKLGIINNLSIEDLKSKLHDNEDREYIDKLYNILCSKGILDKGNTNEKLRPRIITMKRAGEHYEF